MSKILIFRNDLKEYEEYYEKERIQLLKTLIKRLDKGK